MSAVKYLKELRKKERSIKERIASTEKELENPTRVDDQYIQKYRELNVLRIDLKTVRSRINNYGKPRPGIEEYQGVESKIN